MNESNNKTLISGNKTSLIRIVLVTVFILLIPLLAMQLTNEVNWNLFDFIVMGALLFCAGLALEFAAIKINKPAHRAMAYVVIVAVLLLIWAGLSVGIFNIPGISGN